MTNLIAIIKMLSYHFLRDVRIFRKNVLVFPQRSIRFKILPPLIHSSPRIPPLAHHPIFLRPTRPTPKPRIPRPILIQTPLILTPQIHTLNIPQTPRRDPRFPRSIPRTQIPTPSVFQPRAILSDYFSEELRELFLDVLWAPCVVGLVVD